MPPTYRPTGPNRPRGGDQPPVSVLFSPTKPEKELYDELAEQQADQLEINSNQLRRFFGEVKELFRQFDALASAAEPQQREEIYRQTIEPRFKMIRSKVAYASRPAGQSTLPRGFADFLSQGIKLVHGPDDFVKFVTHFEAVVGFMYGNGKVKK